MFFVKIFTYFNLFASILSEKLSSRGLEANQPYALVSIILYLAALPSAPLVPFPAGCIYTLSSPFLHQSYVRSTRILTLNLGTPFQRVNWKCHFTVNVIKCMALASPTSGEFVYRKLLFPLVCLDAHEFGAVCRSWNKALSPICLPALELFCNRVAVTGTHKNCFQDSHWEILNFILSKVVCSITAKSGCLFGEDDVLFSEEGLHW